MYKLAGFDLDGTLLNDRAQLSDLSVSMLKEIRDLSLDIVIVTGRSYFSAAKYFKDTDFDLKIISNNGNLIRNIKDDSLVYINPINKKDALEVISMIDNDNIYPLLHINGFEEGYDIASIYKNTSERVRRYPEGFGERALYLNSFSDLKYDILSIVFAGEYDDLVVYKKIFDEKLSENFNIHLSYVRSKNLYILEVLQKKGDKYYGLEKYLSLVDISFDEVIFAGDDTNDLMIIENAGIGIAMCNGNEAVKKKAQYISAYDNNNEGALREVLKFIRR